jgi:hypothetical protein
MNTLAIIEITLVLVFIVGFILIIKNKKLSVSWRLLWILSLIVFNFIALITFLILRKELEEKNE